MECPRCAGPMTCEPAPFGPDSRFVGLYCLDSLCEFSERAYNIRMECAEGDALRRAAERGGDQ